MKERLYKNRAVLRELRSVHYEDKGCAFRQDPDILIKQKQEGGPMLSAGYGQGDITPEYFYFKFQTFSISLLYILLSI